VVTTASPNQPTPPDGADDDRPFGPPPPLPPFDIYRTTQAAAALPERDYGEPRPAVTPELETAAADWRAAVEASLQRAGYTSREDYLNAADRLGFDPAAGPPPKPRSNGHDPDEPPGRVGTGQGPAILPPDGSKTWPAPPGDAAYHGIAGEVARILEPSTEADPVALLVTMLTLGGAIAGRHRTLWHGSEHAPNLYTVLVGDTAVARKGTAYVTVSAVLSTADDGWQRLLVPGLGSGEALVTRLRPDEKTGRVEHRAIVLETEMGRMLRVMGRDGSTLSAMLRNGWDGTPLGRFIARGGDVVTNHHVAVLAHVTAHDLRDLLRDTDAANGFGNRFCWYAVHRTKLVPLPVDPSAIIPSTLTRALQETFEWAQVPGPVRLSPEAGDDWEDRYGALSIRPRYGLLGALTARAEAQIIRLALTYAVMDRADLVTPDHLLAASALWDYAERSALYIFGNQTGNRWADLLRRHLREQRVLTATQCRDLGIPAVERQGAIDLLVDLGLATTAKRRTAGRSALAIVATDLT
jgi:hypothetical protein